MTIVTVQEAEANLSKLLKLVEAGEEVLIIRGETQVARLVNVEAKLKKQRVPGRWKGKFDAPDAAFAPLSADELVDWEGSI